MGGIYIPNTEKPESCYNHCLEGFIANEEIGCPLKDYAESHQYKNAIHPDCPLIEIDLVRCGECKWFVDDGWGFGHCERPFVGHLSTAEYDFCSYGERRTE